MQQRNNEINTTTQKYNNTIIQQKGLSFLHHRGKYFHTHTNKHGQKTDAYHKPKNHKT
jgi:hypothetical protein